MQRITDIQHVAQRVTPDFMRITMGALVFWIGALKFHDPKPVVGLLDASWSFLASNDIVYLLGAVEIVVAVMLITGVAVRYAGLALMALFAGTLSVLVLGHELAFDGFPYLTLVGQFLLKDLVLFGAAGFITATAPQAVRSPRLLSRMARESATR